MIKNNNMYYYIDKYNYKHTSLNNIKINLTEKNDIIYKLVYCINTTMNKKWYEWLLNFIELVKKYKYNYNDIYIVAVINESDEKLIIKIINDNLKNANLELHKSKNMSMKDLECSEYLGIKWVWELAREYRYKNCYIMFSHSKGISRCDSFKEFINTPNFISIFADNNYFYDNIFNKNLITNIFNLFNNINNIGYHSSSKGFIWWNIWWSRSSYLCTLLEPKNPSQVSSRYYYEEWLSNSNISDFRNNYNLLNKKSLLNKKNLFNIYSYYCPESNMYHNCNNTLSTFKFINYNKLDNNIYFSLEEKKNIDNISYFLIKLNDTIWLKKNKNNDNKLWLIIDILDLDNNCLNISKLNYKFIVNNKYKISLIPNGNFIKKSDFEFIY